MMISSAGSSVSPYANTKTDSQNSSSVQAMISELQSTDSKVRAHENAHIAAGGGVVTGGASFTYAQGPDGKMYATGGEVPISTAEEKTPQETIQKARRIQAAAMAPSDPSPQDYKVAATAAMMEMKAHLEETRTLQNTLSGQNIYAASTS